ncbi:MAG: hypothetical protein ACLP4V_28485 [Methylocella sp.]
MRYDANDQFGGATTFRFAPAFLIPETGTKLKGSIGTGFKAPTLDGLCDNYQAYWFFANPNLKSETSMLHSGQVESTKSAFGARLFLIICSALALALATSSEKMSV